MNKTLAIVVLFVGIFAAVNKTEAAVKNTDVLKGFEIAQNSPWDPREGENPTDNTGREDAPSQSQE